MTFLPPTARATTALASTVLLCTVAVPVSSQDCPEVVGFLECQPASQVAAFGDYAYLGEYDWQAQSSTFVVVDVANPSHPMRRGEVSLVYRTAAMAIADDFAYVLEGGQDSGLNTGLRIIDVSDPDDPAPRGFYPTPGDWGDVASTGNYAYVADSLSGLLIIDVSDPDSPFLAGSYAVSAWRVDVGDLFAYLLIGSDLLVIDVSDPEQPIPLGSIDFTRFASDIAVFGKHAYVTTCGPIINMSPLHLIVIDVSDPSNLMWRGEISRDSSCGSVSVSGPFAYVVYDEEKEAKDNGPNLWVVDVSDPGYPEEAGHVGLAYAAVSYSDGYVYATGEGLHIVRDCFSAFLDGFESGDTTAWSATVP